MGNSTILDVSEIIETFDPDDARVLVTNQLSMLDNDACEIMTDNFKMLYTRYASLKRENGGDIDPELFEQAEDRFFDICDIFIEEISKKFGFTVGDDYLNENHHMVPSIALPLYLFFVLDLRSNLFNVLLSYISTNRDAIADTFKDRASRHDAITAVNRSMDDPVTALIASNIYDVMDWCMEQMDADIFFENMEHGYVAYEPVKQMVDSGAIPDPEGFVDEIREILKRNIPFKARIGFDIICRLKGYRMT